MGFKIASNLSVYAVAGFYSCVAALKGFVEFARAGLWSVPG